MGKKRRSEGEKEEKETESVERRSVGSFSVEASSVGRVVMVFLGDLVEKREDLSDCELETRVDVSVTDVPVSPL